jgi:hypothetical protein
MTILARPLQDSRNLWGKRKTIDGGLLSVSLFQRTEGMDGSGAHREDTDESSGAEPGISEVKRSHVESTAGDAVLFLMHAKAYGKLLSRFEERE